MSKVANRMKKLLAELRSLPLEAIQRKIDMLDGREIAELWNAVKADSHRIIEESESNAKIVNAFLLRDK